MSRDVRAVVLACLREVAPDRDPSTLEPRADLREALDLDSMDVLRLVQALHRELGIELPESAYPRISTLADAIATCEQLQGARGSGAA